MMKLKALLLSLFAVSANVWAETPSGWQVDCVGRVQLGLQGDADVAATTIEDIKRAWRPASSSFTDGQIAYWTSYEFLGGLRLIHGLLPEAQNQYMEERLKIRDSFREDSEKARHENKPYEPFSNLPIGNKNGFGYQIGDQQLFILHMDSYIFSWLGGYRGISKEEAKKNYDIALSGIEVRPLFKVPHKKGVCLPYAFIHDDGNTEHRIAMTYRLKKHPDVTVNLKSSSAQPTPAKDDRPETATNEYNISDYWSQRMMSVNQFETLWHRPRSMRSVRLAGHEGLASFVSVIRNKGDDPDVIYRAVARGNPDAPEAAPDIELVVEQERGNAIKRNIKPLTQDEVLALAKQIAATVVVRPVK